MKELLNNINNQSLIDTKNTFINKGILASNYDKFGLSEAGSVR